MVTLLIACWLLLQLFAAVLIIVGAILGIIAWTQITQVKRILLAHMVIGLIILGLAINQVSVALGRPSLKSNLRYNQRVSTEEDTLGLIFRACLRPAIAWCELDFQTAAGADSAWYGFAQFLLHTAAQCVQVIARAS